MKERKLKNEMYYFSQLVLYDIISMKSRKNVHVSVDVRALRSNQVKQKRI